VDEILILYVCMVFNQFWSAAVAARYVPGGFNFVESVMIGFGMLGRAELAFVVLNIAYVEHSVMSQECFYVLMITCFLLNLTVPIVIGWWRPYYLGEKVLECVMDEPQMGGMGATNFDEPDDEVKSPSAGAVDVELHIDTQTRRMDSDGPIRHFKFTMTGNGTILAASDPAVWYWGHKHELDVIGSKRINGGYDCDPKINKLPNFKNKEEEEKWGSSNMRTIDVEAEGTHWYGTRNFTAKVRRMKVEGSVFQDNLSLRNERWVYNLALHDVSDGKLSTPAGLQPSKSHACIVEMEELTLEQDGTLDWHETARFRKGMEEDVEIDGEGHETFNAAHVGTISVGALLNVIEWLSHGVSLFDTEACP